MVNKQEIDFYGKYVEVHPFMDGEELPEELDWFCEFVIQQNAEQADVFFKKHPDVAEEFLKYFREVKEGEVFYRGGHENLYRTFLSATDDIEVARAFAIYGHNIDESEELKNKGKVFVVTAEKMFRAISPVEEEAEVFLWNPRIVEVLEDYS